MADATNTVESPAEPPRDIRTLTFNLLKFGENTSEAIGSNAAEAEDEFKDFYLGGKNDKGIIVPPVDLKLLDAKANENNALGPCIEAMVTNIDGTGYTFVNRDEDSTEDSEDDTKIQELKDFFDQPWPGVSFTTIRRAVRRDLERTGNGYMEVLRDGAGNIVMLRHVDAKLMRLCKLTDAIPVKKVLRRGGKDVTLNVLERQRKFVQLINGRNLNFFKEFGVERDLNKTTGEWVTPGQRLPARQRATEIIHLTVTLDSQTPYGLPRWIAQTPSVVGSRMAEEFNMDFFKNGGVPPVMVLLQGGTMSSTTRAALERASRGGASKNNRMQVIEVDPTGAFDKANTAKVTVERFGSERQADSMFENYDEKCEIRIRRSFRLPPIFVGQAADYSFATAFASYTVAEAQVFKPERDEFDEIISIKLLPAMGYGDYKMRSNALNIEDATLKLEGLSLLADSQAVSPEDFVQEVSDTIGSKLKADPNAVKRLENQANGLNPDGSKPEPPPPPGMGPGGKPGQSGAKPPGGKPGAAPPKAAPPKVATPSPTPARKSDDPVDDLLYAIETRDPARLAGHIPMLGSLGHTEAADFAERLADGLFVDTHYDPSGMATLAGCTIAMIAAQSRPDVNWSPNS